MRVTSVIDNLDQATAGRLAEQARTGRNRFEVVLDRTDVDHIGIDLHFRLVTELGQGGQEIILRTDPGTIGSPEWRSLRAAAVAASARGQVTWLSNSAGARIAAIVPVREAVPHDGPLLPPASAKGTVNLRALARVVAELLRQRVISPAAIGVPLEHGTEESWNEQVERWLRDG